MGKAIISFDQIKQFLNGLQWWKVNGDKSDNITLF